MGTELLREIESADVLVTRIVIDIGGFQNLSSADVLLDNDKIELRTGRIHGSRHSGRTGPDNHKIIHLFILFSFLQSPGGRIMHRNLRQNHQQYHQQNPRGKRYRKHSEERFHLSFFMKLLTKVIKGAAVSCNLPE